MHKQQNKFDVLHFITFLIMFTKYGKIIVIIPAIIKLYHQQIVAYVFD